MSRWVSSDLLRLAYTYGGTANNGNVSTQAITQGSLSATQSYGYDGVNRLASVTEGSVWSRAYSYDRWGNGWVSASSGLTPDTLTPVAQSNYQATTNRLLNLYSATFDAAGNQTGLNGSTRTYDAENRMITSTISGTATTFSYDGDGRRVKKGSTIYVYDAQGRLAAEYNGSTTAIGTQYLTADHLGSTRLLTDASGTVVSRYDYLPLGEQIAASVNGRSTSDGYPAAQNLSLLKQLFTGKERDAETGLDYFGARYFSAAQGRFTTPDEFAGGPVDAYSGAQVEQPGPLPYADIANPQSLNKYAYVLNSPLRYTDPDGHCVWDLCVLETAVTVTVATIVAAGAIYYAERTGEALGNLISERGRPNNVSPPPPPTSRTNQKAETATPPPPGIGNQGDDRNGGGKTGRKQNADRAKSAEEKLKDAKDKLAEVQKQNPRPEGYQKSLQKAKDLVKHWTKKAAETSEEHARVAQH